METKMSQKIKLAKYSDCTGCGSCKAACHKNAIIFDYDKNGHLYPFIDETKCIRCGQCQKKCPILNPQKLQWGNPLYIRTFTAWSKDNELCVNSTSGGVFAQLAHDFINKYQGYVFGVELSDHNTCKHIEVSKIQDVSKIVGTKYLQSDASESYRMIQTHLLHSEPCLFSGTPCQIAGLYCFLGNISTEKLYSIELICHGVPSKYITDLACKYYDADHILSYRNKETGWHKGFSCKYQKSSGEVIENQPDDFFFRRFGIAERLACYKCKYAKINRLADLTIGDQWGLMEQYPERIKYGANLSVVNTPKGLELLCSDNISIDENQTSTLNAPTLFAPREMPHITRLISMLKKLPMKWQYIIATLNWKEAKILLPVELYMRIKEKNYQKRIQTIILKTRKSLSW